ncbi:thiol-disulfide oxidoreductase DCC family protein [Lacibacter sp. MH-610]|uniref:thiol-disulfide oxidoreductase DCC family protein n=1 Tax=Lacibacter sp. MH-610 TaxID=3020883 RepID=UPI003892975D
MTEQSPAGKKQFIVLFDGVCNLCSSSVQFILKRDHKDQFLFGSLQGNYGQGVLSKYGMPPNEFNSFMLLEGERLYTKSSGALRMLRHLGGAWRLLYAFIIVPKFIRDAVYNFIAQNRYRWFGKKEECWLPKPEWKKKFLD